MSGVFLPAKSDILSLQNPPETYTDNTKVTEGQRNSAGDIDREYHSLKSFMRLAAEGQPRQLEMLFAPGMNYLSSTNEWQYILKNKELFLSRKGISPFIGFAIGQAHKATIKGEHLRQIRDILKWGDKVDEDRKKPLQYHVPVLWDKEKHSGTMSFSNVTTKTTIFPDPVDTFATEAPVFVNDHGFAVVEIAGRKYDINLQLKTFLGNLKELANRYGARSRETAERGFDFKSLMHAYRLLYQAEEYLLTGHITFPRPEAQELKDIRAGLGAHDGYDWFSDLMGRIDRLRQEVEPKSPLPKIANWSKIDELYEEIMWNHMKANSK